MNINFAFASGVGFEGDAGARYCIDSKSMRKVGPDDNLVGVFSQENAVGSTIAFMGRRLIQLH